MNKDIRFTENQTVVNLHEDKHFQTLEQIGMP
jgi:hypothetical protein